MRFKNNKERFEQLEKCNFVDVKKHKLEMNVAYDELKKDSYSIQDLKDLSEKLYRYRWHIGKDNWENIDRFIEALKMLQEGKDLAKMDMDDDDYPL